MQTTFAMVNQHRSPIKGMDMKIFRLYLQIFVLLSFLFIGCKKDEKILGCKKYVIHLQKISNGEPISNYELSFRRKKIFISYSPSHSYVIQDTTLLSQKSDAKGNICFLVPTNLLQNERDIFYVIGGAEGPSNTKNINNNFILPGDRVVYSNNDQSDLNFTLNLISSTKCKASVIISTEDCAVHNIDSVIIYSSIVNHYNFIPIFNWGSSYNIDWPTNCYDSNKIYYYYYSQGIKSKEYSIRIEPNYDYFPLEFQ